MWLLISLLDRIHLGQDMHTHTQEDPEIYRVWTENQASKISSVRGNSGQMPHESNSNYQRVELSLNPPVCLSTLSVLFLLPINTCFTTFCLYGNYFYTVDRPAGPWPLTCDLVVRIQHSSCRCPTSGSGKHWNSASIHYRLRQLRWKPINTFWRQFVHLTLDRYEMIPNSANFIIGMRIILWFC